MTSQHNIGIKLMALAIATTSLSGVAVGQELPRETVIIDTNKFQSTKACLEAFSSVQTSKDVWIVCSQHGIDKYKEEMVQPGRWSEVQDLGDGVLCGIDSDGQAIRFMFMETAEGQYYHIMGHINVPYDSSFLDLYIAGQRFLMNHDDKQICGRYLGF